MSKRTIPRIGAAVLLLGGCYSSRPSGGGGGGGGGGGSAGSMAATSYCEALDACDSAYVDYAFGGLAACIDEVAEYFEYAAAWEADDNGEVCGDALLAYYECWVEAFDGCYERTSEEDPFFEYDYAQLDGCAEAALATCPALAEPVG